MCNYAYPPQIYIPEPPTPTMYMAVVVHKLPHFLFLNTMLKTMQTALKTSPKATSTAMTPVRNGSIVTISTRGTPSYGIPSIHVCACDCVRRVYVHTQTHYAVLRYKHSMRLVKSS